MCNVQCAICNGKDLHLTFLSNPSEVWQERWAYERWVCQQRLSLLNLLLGSEIPDPEMDESWEELVKWVETRVVAEATHDLGRRESPMEAREEVWRRLVKKLLEDRTGLARRVERLQIEIVKHRETRDRLEMALREKSSELTMETHENLRLQQWVTKPVEVWGQETQVQAERIRELKLTVAALEARLRDAQVREGAERDRAEEHRHALERGDARYTQDREWWERQMREERDRGKQIEATVLEWQRRAHESDRAISEERLKALEREADLTHRGNNERQEWQRELHLRDQRFQEAVKSVKALRHRLQEVHRTRRLHHEEEWALHEAIRQQGVRLFREVVFGVVNQVRNALAVMRGNSQLLAQDAPPKSKAVELAQSVVTGSDDLERQLEQVEEVVGVRIQAISPVALGDLVREGAARAQEMADRLRVKIDMKGVEGVPLVIGDEGLVRRMFWEVLVNGMEAMPQGGQVTVTAQTRERHVDLRVEDEGVFDPKHVEEWIIPSFSSKGGHAGFGLTFVMCAMQVMGGQVMFGPVSPHGTSVTLRLRRAAAGEFSGDPGSREATLPGRA